MNNHTMNRRQLMNHINQVSFAVDEVKLYLDTHPCDQEALSYFQKMSRERDHALKEYASAYGPLTVDTADQSCTCLLYTSRRIPLACPSWQMVPSGVDPITGLIFRALATKDLIPVRRPFFRSVSRFSRTKYVF